MRLFHKYLKVTGSHFNKPALTEWSWYGKFSSKELGLYHLLRVIFQSLAAECSTAFTKHQNKCIIKMHCTRHANMLPTLEFLFFLLQSPLFHYGHIMAADRGTKMKNFLEAEKMFCSNSLLHVLLPELPLILKTFEFLDSSIWM